MQEMSHRHSRELDIFYNEHKNCCTNCGRSFVDGMCAYLGYLSNQYLVAITYILKGATTYISGLQLPTFIICNKHHKNSSHPQIELERDAL